MTVGVEVGPGGSSWHRQAKTMLTKFLFLLKALHMSVKIRFTLS